ncbi:ribonuclease III [Propylenella binzhouense]|uniref:Ribonuclease 3 n=1 Tax=Propylenella binzhouense TaxID=2555902 RepID=A0A964WUC7_9HYPH|nr:ribonuclease III [Propylenella binzhouense]MYZ48710.1 ribonuclease III [Propylenella binzhouense]
MRRHASLAELEERIGYRFRDAELLQRALTHASAVANGVEHQPLDTYQRLEFLGDRVLGLVIADMLDAHYETAPEGELSRRLAKLVSGETCAKVAREMDLPAHLRIGGSVKGASRATAGVLADVCEAVIGAAYRDGGLDAARGVVERFWRTRLETMSGPLRDAKTELQEWSHRHGYGTPVYEEISRSGPDHAPRFEVEVRVDGVESARGQGRAKREAEHEAASELLMREGVWSRE